MWNTTQAPKKPANFKPLKLISKVPPEKPRIDLPAVPSSSRGASRPQQSWQKEFELTRILNRERKNLSTATSSTNESDSRLASRIPVTPSDLPISSDKLCILDERADAAEDRITSRNRLFDQLEKDYMNLNAHMQKELKSSAFAQTLKFASKKKKDDETNQDCQNPPSPVSSSDEHWQWNELLRAPEVTSKARKWGAYLKTLW